MQAAAAVLKGKHDFPRVHRAQRPPNEDTVRDLRRLGARAAGRPQHSHHRGADGFLYKMVRSLVGALVAVGEGKLTPAEVRAMLASKTRTAAVSTAPPQGLFLRKSFLLIAMRTTLAQLTPVSATPSFRRCA